MSNFAAMKKNVWFTLTSVAAMAAIVLFTSCSIGTKADDGTTTADIVPAAPDYSRADTWYATCHGDSTGTDADVFYILPTCILDYTDSLGRTMHLAEIYNDELRLRMKPSLELADSIFGDSCNFYSPYYRQISMESWGAPDSVMARRLAIAMGDVEDAFDYYMEHLNNGRRFFIAGFSQGAKITIELVKRLTPEQMQRFVAAYVCGYNVTDEDLKSSNIRPATGATDQHVTICYNTSESAEARLGAAEGGSRICINPVSWQTGTDTAMVNDSVWIHVDTTYHYLQAGGRDMEQYFRPELEWFFPHGNLHLYELIFYKEHLRRNVMTRLHAADQ